MPNGLTGDFDAVLEVSGATLNRIAATMHQNGFSEPALPTVPHIVHFRIGDSGRLGGVRGSVAAQTGTPQIVLIDGATDRFWVETAFRARYRKDPGSTSLADVIHGTVRALYRVESVDPSCPGWADIADDYVWLRVDRSSVTFDGSAYSESDTLRLHPERAREVHRLIRSHLARLLVGPLQPRPHRISAQFRRLITRSTPFAAGVAIPLGLDGDSPTGGAVASIQGLFLDGHDFAVAISSDYLVDRLRSQLNGLVGHQTNVHITGDAGIGGGLEIDYHFRVDTIAAEWVGATALNLPGGLIRITVGGSGWATRLYRSGVYNLGSMPITDLDMTVAASQFVMLQFDASGERLWLSAVAEPSIVPNYDGPYANDVKAGASATMAQQFKTLLATHLVQAQAELDQLDAAGKKYALIEQLKTIDAAPGAAFVGAEFPDDGVVLRGSIRLSHRQAPRALFDKADAGHFDAIESWIPGGRVDSFEWSWRWFGHPVQAAPGTSGAASEDASFLLQRPPGPRNRYGLTLGAERPLPGLDGPGKVCLSITGVQVDPITGALVPVRSVMECAQFGYQFKIPAEVGPYLRVCDPWSDLVDEVHPEVGLLRVSASRDTDATQNTLAVYLGEQWDDDAAASIISGVDSCRRQFAGLLVLVLFRDGALSSPRLTATIRDFTAVLAAPALITEDVRGRWSQYLGFNDSNSLPSWRIVNPAGVPVWARDGHLNSQELAAVLDEHLEVSRPAESAQLGGDLRIGDRIHINLIHGDCPPVALARPRTIGSRVGFLDTGPASMATLQNLQRSGSDADEPPCAAVVIDGASQQDVRRLGTEFGSAIPLFADPDGSITRSSGVVFTPCLLTLDPLGTVTAVQTEPPSATGKPQNRYGAVQ